MRKSLYIFAIGLSIFSLNICVSAQRHQEMDEQIAFAFNQNFPDWKPKNPKTFKSFGNHYPNPTIESTWTNGKRELRANIRLYETDAQVRESFKMFILGRSVIPKHHKFPELGDPAYVVETANRIELDFAKENVRISLNYDFPVAAQNKNKPPYYFPAPPEEVEFMKKVGRVIADSFSGRRIVTPCYNDFYRNIYLNELTPKEKFFGAVYRADIDSINDFIKNGIDVNVRDDKSKSALHLAIHHGCFETVKFLVDAGSDLNARDKNGLTPIMYAALFGDLDVVKLLISNGADLQIQDKHGRNILFQTLSIPNFGFTAWRIVPDEQRELKAEKIDKIPIFRELLKAGMNFNTRDNSGDSLLIKYIGSFYKSNDHILQMLLDCGVEVNAKNNSNRTALISLAAHGSFDDERRLSIIKFLLSKGADVNVKDHNNLSAIDYLKEIESTNIKINLSEEKMIAIRESIKLLIKAGAKE